MINLKSHQEERQHGIRAGHRAEDPGRLGKRQWRKINLPHRQGLQVKRGNLKRKELCLMSDAGSNPPLFQQS
jgi:hypothetical protein